MPSMYSRFATLLGTNIDVQFDFTRARFCQVEEARPPRRHPRHHSHLWAAYIRIVRIDTSQKTNRSQDTILLRRSSSSSSSSGSAMSSTLEPATYACSSGLIIPTALKPSHLVHCTVHARLEEGAGRLKVGSLVPVAKVSSTSPSKSLQISVG